MHKPTLIRMMLFVLTASAITACVKQEDLTVDSFSEWNPNLAVPLIDDYVSFADLTGLADPTSVRVDEQGRICFVGNSSEYSMDAASFVNIPDITDTGSLSLSPQALQMLGVNGSFYQHITSTLSLNAGATVVLDTMILKSTKIDFTYLNSLNRAGTVTISIPSATKNGVAFNQTIAFTAGSGANPSNNFHQFNLAGYTIRFQSGSQPNSVPVDYTINYIDDNIHGPVSGTGMQYTAVLNSVTYSYASGDFGNMLFNIPVDTAAISFFSETPVDSFYFSDPKLKVSFENGVGAPLSISGISILPLDKYGQLIELISNPALPDPKNINAAAFVGDVAYDSILVNAQNSNLPYIISQKPANIVYGANAQLNPGGMGLHNFITDQSKFVARLSAEVPVDGWASRFYVEDTFDFGMENVEEIESATFRLTAVNGFPMSAQTQVYFVDSAFNVLDSLLNDPAEKILDGAAVNSQGVAISPKQHTHDETFDQNRMETLTSCKKVIIHSTLSTTDAPSTSVKIMQHDRLNVKIGVQARLKINFN